MHLRSSITLLIVALVFPLTACDDKDGDDAVDASQISDAKPGKRVPEESSTDAEADGEPATPDRTGATSENAGTINQVPPLPVDDFFKMQDVASLSKDGLKGVRLAGQEPSETYNSLRIHPAGRHSYGAAVQMWKFESSTAAAARVKELRMQYLGVGDPASDAPVKDRAAFLSERQDIWQYVFNPKGKPYVASVTCAREFCQSEKIVYEIGSKVNTRILEEGKEKEASDATKKDLEKDAADDKKKAAAKKAAAKKAAPEKAEKKEADEK